MPHNEIANLVINNPTYIDSLYKQFLEDPNSVKRDFQLLFTGAELTNPLFLSTNGHHQDSKTTNVNNLIQAFRKNGHLIANTNPIRKRRKHETNLHLKNHNLTKNDLQTSFPTKNIANLNEKEPLETILKTLQKIYTGPIGVEISHCNEKIQHFVYDHLENNPSKYSNEQQLQLHTHVQKAVLFEKFLHTKYVGKKRFSIEGHESVVPALSLAIDQAPTKGIKEVGRFW